MFGATYTWFWMALMAAVMWGLSYALSGRILKEGISSPYLLIFFSIFQVIFLGIYLIVKKTDFFKSTELIVLKPSILVMLTVSALSIFIGNLLIFASAQQKNIVLASIIEISYPLFAAMFAYLLFREMHLNMYTAFGAFLITAGVVLVLVKA